MRTCHLVYSTGLPRLFKGVVLLDGVDAIRSFYHHMVSLSKTGRSSLLRALEVRSDHTMALYPGYRIEARCGLTTILHNAANLRRVCMDFALFCESQSTTSVYHSLVALKTLEEFSIRNIAHPLDIGDLLQDLQSPIRSLGLQTPFGCSRGPISMKDTLTKLVMRNVLLDNPSLQFLHVRELVISDQEEIRFMDPSIWVQMFPNLRELSVNAPYKELIKQDTLEKVRIRNRDRLSRLANPWKELGSFHGRLNMLYGLGLRCHIKRVGISADSPHIPEQMVELLQEVRPSVLGIWMHGLPLMFFLPRELPTLLAHVSAMSPFLSGLYIDIDCISKPARPFTRHWVRHLFESDWFPSVTHHSSRKCYCRSSRMSPSLLW